MKAYEAPKLEVILFQTEDCITASSPNRKQRLLLK